MVLQIQAHASHCAVRRGLLRLLPPDHPEPHSELSWSTEVQQVGLLLHNLRTSIGGEAGGAFITYKHIFCLLNYKTIVGLHLKCI